MNRLGFAILTILCVLNLAAMRESEKVTCHVQLIRGTDQQPIGNVKLAGPKLTKKLSSFRWKNYWEVNRQTVSLSRAQTTKVKLSDSRDVHLSLLNASEVEIKVYRANQLTQKCRQSIQEKMAIVGGEREKDEAWFVVVRPDKPD